VGKFLNLAAFIALLLGCIGIASSVHIYIKEKLKAIKQAIDTYLEPNLQVVFKREDRLIRSERGKLKQFISHL
jgi:hypothetical protein